jgi:hypothetical protein
MALSYAILGVSALAWPLVHALVPGFALVLLTGFLEGPAYSGSIAVRQREAPPALRAQVLTTISGVTLVAASAGSALGGLTHRPLVLFVAFTVINAFAAVTVWRAGSRMPP